MISTDEKAEEWGLEVSDVMGYEIGWIFMKICFRFS